MLIINWTNSILAIDFYFRIFIQNSLNFARLIQESLIIISFVLSEDLRFAIRDLHIYFAIAS